MFCPNCGKENSGFAKFCEDCGALLPEADVNNYETNAVESQNQTMGNAQGFGMEQTQAPAAAQGFGMEQTQAPSAAQGFGMDQTQAPGAAQGFGMGQTQAPGAAQGFGMEQTQAPAAAQGFGMDQTQAPGAAQGFGINPTPVNNQNISVPTINPSTPYPSYQQGNIGTTYNGNTAPMSYQSSTMPPAASTAAVKSGKSKKGLVIGLVVIGILVVLGIAGFIIFKMISGSLSTKMLYEHPTEYLAGTYISTAQNVFNDDDIMKVLVSDSKKRTVKTTIKQNDTTITTTSAFDRTAKKAYYGISSSGSFSFELYTDINHHVIKATSGSESVDYVINSENLRENAKTSIFGPGGVLGVNEDQYNTFMDIYEYLYKNMMKPEDEMFGFKDLGKKICEDIDKCGNATVDEKTVQIFDKEVSAYAVNHTFSDTSVIDAVYLDLKDWADKNVDINPDIREQILKAIEQMDPLKASSPANDANFKLVINSYLNKKSHAIMKMTAELTVDEKTSTISITFGEDPSSTNKIEVVTNGDNEKDNANFTIERQSDSKNDKYVLDGTISGKTGTVTFIRDKSTGDFTLSSTTGTKEYKGNMKTTANSLTLTISDIDGENTSMEYYISTEAEITELSSDNDILKMSVEDLQKDIQKISAAFQGLAGPLTSISSPTNPVVDYGTITDYNNTDNYNIDDYYTDSSFNLDDYYNIANDAA